MKKDVFEYVQECLTCQKVKQSRNVHSAKMIPLRPKRPLELIAAEIIGPLPISTNGKKTGQHSNLNRQLDENQKITSKEVTKVNTTQTDENETVLINSSGQNSIVTVSLYKHNYYLQKLVRCKSSEKSQGPIRNRKRPDFYQAEEMTNFNHDDKMSKNDEDFLLKTPLDYVSENKVEACGLKKINNDNNVTSTHSEIFSNESSEFEEILKRTTLYPKAYDVRPAGALKIVSKVYGGIPIVRPPSLVSVENLQNA
ncbi:unnamed protein product [Brachionus calyciflorus]|uniref:Integrase zinc-binding domain-containing protein n=1 Tax=Brachionus calyciflorus TaxID=104777 RepID=A0A814Q5S9_9BILA|nr:unnamed protein product [Brachionus calyciflorus]